MNKIVDEESDWFLESCLLIIIACVATTAWLQF
jgi:hypothetical protein